MSATALLALQAATEYRRLGRLPPVTSGLILANVLLFLRTDPSSLPRVCFNPHLVLRDRDPVRFLLSTFYHANEPHLLYNMLSLLWKGARLETSLGSLQFASAVASLLALSQSAALVLTRSLLLLGHEAPYYHHCSVGFSGVLFALKVVLGAQSSASVVQVHGVPIPSRYAAWAELILVQLLVPDASFIGHLAGILAGMLYLRLTRSISGLGFHPLALLFRRSLAVLTWPFRFLGGYRGRLSGRGRVGRASDSGSAGGVWRCAVCTFDNSASVDECEMCSTARGPLHDRGHVSVEELRQRRLRRFHR